MNGTTRILPNTEKGGFATVGALYFQFDCNVYNRAFLCEHFKTARFLKYSQAGSVTNKDNQTEVLFPTHLLQ